MKKVVIIDYKLSNLYNVKHALEHYNINPVISSNKNDIYNADGIILPGVGAFGDAMNNLKKYDLIEPIKDFLSTGKPFMGICLGFQLLFSESEEFGSHKGLDIIKGVVKKFPHKINNKKVKVPQIGWNTIFKPNEYITWANSPLKELKEKEYMYFVHSYYVVPSNTKDILSITNYEDIIYCSSINKNNIFAVQFHPERSAQKGLSIYKNWIDTL